MRRRAVRGLGREGWYVACSVQPGLGFDPAGRAGAAVARARSPAICGMSANGSDATSTDAGPMDLGPCGLGWRDARRAAADCAAAGRCPAIASSLTHMTPTGRQTGAELFGAEMATSPAASWCSATCPTTCRRCLTFPRISAGGRHADGDRGLAEPGARRLAGVPLCPGHRLSPRSFRRTARFGRAAAAMYADFTEVLAQTQGDADASRAGREAAVRDQQPEVRHAAIGRADRARATAAPGLRPAAGVGRGEYARGRGSDAARRAVAQRKLCGDVWGGVRGDGVRRRLLLVPRAQRFDAVAAMVTQTGYAAAPWRAG